MKYKKRQLVGLFNTVKVGGRNIVQSKSTGRSGWYGYGGQDREIEVTNGVLTGPRDVFHFKTIAELDIFQAALLKEFPETIIETPTMISFTPRRKVTEDEAAALVEYKEKEAQKKAEAAAKAERATVKQRAADDKARQKERERVAAEKALTKKLLEPTVSLEEALKVLRRAGMSVVSINTPTVTVKKK